MKSVQAMLGVGLLILMLGAIMGALVNFRATDFDEPHIIATDVDIESTTIVLANEVMDAATTNVGIVSNNADDAPIPWSYTNSNRQLIVNGLSANATRTLTVTYKVSQLDGFTDTAARFLPAFLILGGIGIIAGAVVEAYRHR